MLKPAGLVIYQRPRYAESQARLTFTDISSAPLALQENLASNVQDLTEREGFATFLALMIHWRRYINSWSQVRSFNSDQPLILTSQIISWAISQDRM